MSGGGGANNTLESPADYEKLATDARVVLAAVAPVHHHFGKLDFERVKEMLRSLQRCGMWREDRKTSLIHMLNTPLGAAFGADAGRAWCILQP